MFCVFPWNGNRFVIVRLCLILSSDKITEDERETEKNFLKKINKDSYFPFKSFHLTITMCDSDNTQL